MAKVTQERDMLRAQLEKHSGNLGKHLTLMFQLDRYAKHAMEAKLDQDGQEGGKVAGE